MVRMLIACNTKYSEYCFLLIANIAANAECQRLRDVFGISTDSYEVSLRGHCDAHFDGGKSGAIFFFSADERYIVKEVASSERKELLNLMPHYVNYMERHPDSLLPRIVQVCSIRMYRKTLNFMVMQNVFATENGVVRPDTVYDIKGSWVDRNASGTRDRRPTSGTYKDMDLNEKLFLPIAFRRRLQQVLHHDTQFLARNNIMDYSLLLGVCKVPFLNDAIGGKERQLPQEYTPTQGDCSGSQNVPFWKVDEGGMAAAVIRGPGVYHIGLVDILQVMGHFNFIPTFLHVPVLLSIRAWTRLSFAGLRFY